VRGSGLAKSWQMHPLPRRNVLGPAASLAVVPSILALAGLPLIGCFPNLPGVPPPDATTAMPGPAPCRFDFDGSFHRVLRGGRTLLRNFGSPAYPDWDITVMDPAIATARFTNGEIEIDGLAAGSTMFVAHGCNQTRTYPFTVAPAARIEIRVPEMFGFFSSPIGTTLTAIAGTTDALEITYLGAEGDKLNGIGAAAYSYEGGISRGDHPIVPPTEAVDGVALEYPVFSFAAAGRLTLAGDFGVVPIDISVAAQPAELRIYPELFSTFRLAIAGSTDGQAVAGVTASWDVQPTDHVEVTTPTTGVRDIAFRRKADGSPSVPLTVTPHPATASVSVSL
jgi:hypothetical protein